MINKLLSLLLPTVLLISCRTGNVEISGVIENAAGTRVYLERQDVDRIVTTDSAKIDRSGKFSFRVEVTTPVYYAVRMEKEVSVSLVAEADKNIFVTGKQPGLVKNYQVEGSEASALIRELTLRLNATTTAMDSLEKIHRSLPVDKACDEERFRVSAEWDSAVAGQIRFSKEFIVEHAISPAAYYALYQKWDPEHFVLDPAAELDSYKVVLSSLMAFYPESPYTKALSGHYEQIRKNIQTAQIQEVIRNSEATLPDIRIPDRTGQEQSLSSLKGKYILLDFTLLTSKAGLGHTEELKQLYTRYRSEGLEIFQVCLDPNKLLWEEVVETLRIDWICLLDPEGAESKVARTWNIREIPANYLINKQYEIVGKNLYGQRLRDRLADVIR